MRIGNTDYKVRVKYSHPLKHAFRHETYWCKYQGKKENTFWLDMHFFFLNLFAQREEACWYTIHFAFFGVGVPDYGNMALLGFERDYSWEDNSVFTVDDEWYGEDVVNSTTTYTLNFLWFFDLQFSKINYLDFDEDEA